VLAVAVGGHYYDSYDLSDALGTDEPGAYTSVHLNLNYGVAGWLEAAIDVPFRRAVWEGADGAEVAGLDGPTIVAKVGPPGLRAPLGLALEGRVTLPLEQELSVGSAGESHFLTGGGAADSEIILLTTLDLTERFPLRLHANVGWAFNAESRGRRFHPDYYPPLAENEDTTHNDALILRAALEFPGRNVDLFLEYEGDVSQKTDAIASKENAHSVTPGLRVRLGDYTATAGFSVGISGNDGSTEVFDPHVAFPDWELRLSLGYSWPATAADTDGDGIPDFRDDCRMRAEDPDGYEDDDGCPDPDNDGDSIPDSQDAAPNLAEDLDGFEDGDGVPDLDNDGDGIIDARDMCPDEREDLDGFEDDDGCPDS
jgi:hypothetical protein